MVRSHLDHKPNGKLRIAIRADIDSSNTFDSDISKSRKTASRRLATSFGRLKLALRQRPAITFSVLGFVILVLLFIVESQRIASFNEDVLPKGGTSKDVPRAANGDVRFMRDGQMFAMTQQGGMYVADEDLVEPRLTFMGRGYNKKNARILSPKPGLITILPDFLAEDEVETIKQHRQLAYDVGASYLDSTLVQYGDLEKLVMNRLRPFVQLDMKLAAHWDVRHDEKPAKFWQDYFKEKFQVGSKEVPKSMDEFRKFMSVEIMKTPFDFGIASMQSLTNTWRKGLAVGKHGHIGVSKYADHGSVAKVILFLDEPTFEDGGSGGDLVMMNRHMSEWLHRVLYYNTWASQMGLQFYDTEIFDRIEMNAELRGARNSADKQLDPEDQKLYKEYLARAVELCKFNDSEKDRRKTASLIDDFIRGGAFKIRPKKGTAVVIHSYDISKFHSMDTAYFNENSYHGSCEFVGNFTAASFEYKSRIYEANAYREKQIRDSDGIERFVGYLTEEQRQYVLDHTHAIGQDVDWDERR